MIPRADQAQQFETIHAFIMSHPGNCHILNAQEIAALKSDHPGLSAVVVRASVQPPTLSRQDTYPEHIAQSTVTFEDKSMVVVQGNGHVRSGRATVERAMVYIAEATPPSIPRTVLR